LGNRRLHDFVSFCRISVCMCSLRVARKLPLTGYGSKMKVMTVSQAKEVS
jgi:hypothetical protein